MFLLFFNYRRFICIAVLLSTALYGHLTLAQPPHDPDEIIGRVRDTLASITDYTCIFSKHELVGDRIIKEDNIILKVKKPGHFYMKWTKGPNKGRVAIYVEGRNNNKILIHTGGLLGFFPVSIDPNGKRALRENRHSITEVDFISIFKKITSNYSMCRADPECNPLVIDLKDSGALELKLKFPPGKGYYAHRGYLTIDTKTWLPTGLICYGWDDEFLEEYRFSDIKINPGLKERDFKKDW